VFVSFFPKPKLFFLSAAGWSLLLILLWFFGGDCLHFMPDEEIELYQTLDERRYQAEQQGEVFDWNQEKQLLALPADSSKH